MLYIVVGQWRLPWGFQIYRGKDTPSPTELGLRLLRQLPKILTQRFEVLVLADTAFGSNDFVTKVRQLEHHVLVGVRCNRNLEDGRCLAQLHKRGQQLRLSGLKSRLHVSWYYFQREDGKWEKRYVICTKTLKASTITWWGRRRWQIEGFFKTIKHRFSFHRFGESALREGFPRAGSANPEGQQTLIGVYR